MIRSLSAESMALISPSMIGRVIIFPKPFVPEDMIAARVEPYPRDVWIWGIQNRVGALRTLPIDDVRRNLLPHANASATLEGVYFRWMLYTCDSAIQEQWFEQMNKGMKKSLTI